MVVSTCQSLAHRRGWGVPRQPFEQEELRAEQSLSPGSGWGLPPTHSAHPASRGPPPTHFPCSRTPGYACNVTRVLGTGTGRLEESHLPHAVSWDSAKDGGQARLRSLFPAIVPSGPRRLHAPSSGPTLLSTSSGCSSRAGGFSATDVISHSPGGTRPEVRRQRGWVPAANGHLSVVPSRGRKIVSSLAPSLRLPSPAVTSLMT